MKRVSASSKGLLLAVIVLLVACSHKRNTDIIAPDKLERVLYDYHLAQVMVSDMSSGERYKRDFYFEYVYDKHGVTKAQFDSTLVYYARYPKGLSEIYANLSKRIEKEIQRIEDEDKPLKSREAVSVVGDSVDLWYDKRYTLMTPHYLDNNKYTFTIPTDTNFKYCDLIEWRGKVLFSQSKIDTLHKYLHINLRVKYTNDSIVSADTLLYASGRFAVSVSNAALVKSIDGTAYLKCNDVTERVLIVEPSLMRYRQASPTDSLDNK